MKIDQFRQWAVGVLDEWLTGTLSVMGDEANRPELYDVRRHYGAEAATTLPDNVMLFAVSRPHERDNPTGYKVTVTVEPYTLPEEAGSAHANDHPEQVN